MYSSTILFNWTKNVCPEHIQNFWINIILFCFPNTIVNWVIWKQKFSTMKTSIILSQLTEKKLSLSTVLTSHLRILFWWLGWGSCSLFLGRFSFPWSVPLSLLSSEGDALHQRKYLLDSFIIIIIITVFDKFNFRNFKQGNVVHTAHQNNHV